MFFKVSNDHQRLLNHTFTESPNCLASTPRRPSGTFHQWPRSSRYRQGESYQRSRIERRSDNLAMHNHRENLLSPLTLSPGFALLGVPVYYRVRSKFTRFNHMSFRSIREHSTHRVRLQRCPNTLRVRRQSQYPITWCFCCYHVCTRCIAAIAVPPSNGPPIRLKSPAVLFCPALNRFDPLRRHEKLNKQTNALHYAPVLSPSHPPLRA